MGKFLTIAAAGVALTALAAGCNTSGCQDNGSAIPLAAFYASDTGSPVTLDSLAIYGLGAPADSAARSRHRQRVPAHARLGAADRLED